MAMVNKGWGADDPSSFGGVVDGALDPFNLFGRKKYEDNDPMGGMAQYPTYIGMEPDQLQVGNQFMGNAPMQKFNQEAMRGGPSQGTQFALNQNRIAATQGVDQSRKMANNMAAQSNTNLAMKGGLSAGAQQANQKNAANMAGANAQGAEANAATNRSNLLVQDEAQRVGQLGQAGQMQMAQNGQNYSMAAGDLTRQQGEYDRRNAFNMNNYNQKMSAWGAGKTADAQAHSGKKG